MRYYGILQDRHGISYLNVPVIDWENIGQVQNDLGHPSCLTQNNCGGLISYGLNLQKIDYGGCERVEMRYCV